MDLLSLIQRLIADGTIGDLANNGLAQFGVRSRPHLGATVLPELNTENEFTDTGIRYRTVIANDGSRYGPAQLKTDEGLFGQVHVAVGHSDIGRQFTGRDYDLFLRFLRTRPEMEAIPRLLDWLDTTVLRALNDLNEKQRWQAMIDAQVQRRGDNGYTENVTYPNPTGHRVTVAGTWSSDAYDPFLDIQTGVDLLASKGYAVSRMVTSGKNATILGRNAKVRQRGTTTISVDANGTIVGRPPLRLAAPALNAALRAEGFPALEVYDERYRDYQGSKRFLREDAFIMVGTTGRDTDFAEAQFEANGTIPTPLTDTLGYLAVGRPVGENDSGRVIRMWPYDNKPPRIEAEGWQATIPVLTEPEAIWVASGIG